MSRETLRGASLIGVTIMGIVSSVACAQSYDVRTRFTLGWGKDAIPITEPLVITEPGTYNFELQQGVFNAVGFTNYGVGNWIGSIRSSEPLLTQPPKPRPTPMNDWRFGQDGVINEDGTQIGYSPETDIDSAHLIEEFLYKDEVPFPEPYGAEEFISLYRFSLTIDDTSQRDIELSAIPSYEFNYVIRDWLVLRHTPAIPEKGILGYIQYGSLGINPVRTPETNMTIRVIPAPAAGLLLGLTMWPRRRRR